MQTRRLLCSVVLALASCDVKPITDSESLDAESINPRFDVIVVGAGAGGIAAAIQSARMGATVAVIESSNHVGGQLLTVTSMDMVGPEREEGIYAEFVKRVEQHYDVAYNHKPIRTCNFNDSSVCFEARDGEQILRDMLVEARVHVETGVDVVAISTGGPHEIVGLTTSDGRAWTARIVIDATEYGDIMPLAGAAYRVGNQIREPGDPVPADVDACVQETTYTLTIKKYDVLPPELDLTFERVPPGPDYASRVELFRNVRASSTTTADCSTQWSWECHSAYRGTPDRDNPDNYISSDYRHTKTMINALNDYPTLYSLPDQGLPIAAIEDPIERRRHECGARMLTTQFLYYSQAELRESWGASDEMSPYGLNADHCEELGPIEAGTERLFPVRPYVREARRLVGVRTVTGSDIERIAPSTFRPFAKMARRSWATAMSLGYYGTDMHGCYGDRRLESDLGDSQAQSSTGGPYQVPFGAFIPRDIDGLLVVEKNLSMSRLVNSAMRLQPSSMLNGMAAGAIAGVAVARAIRVRDVPPVLVQDALLSSAVPNNLSLYTFDDVPRSSPHWSDVQLASTHGVLTGYGNFQFGADQPLTRGQASVVLQRVFRYAIDPPSSTVYADVPTSHPLWKFVQAMTREQLTSGCGSAPDGSILFCPDRSTLRKELAIWIAVALALPPTACAAEPYPDVPITDPACPFIAAIKSAGLAVPCAGGQFCPTQNLTRADAAAFARKAMVYMASHDATRGACYRTPPEYCEP